VNKISFSSKSLASRGIIKQKSKLEIFNKSTINIETVETLERDYKSNLDNATDEDWRFILETLGVKVYMFGDGTWDIEINVPIVNSIPGSSGFPAPSARPIGPVFCFPQKSPVQRS